MPKKKKKAKKVKKVKRVAKIKPSKNKTSKQAESSKPLRVGQDEKPVILKVKKQPTEKSFM